MDQLQAGMNLYKFIWTNNLFAPNLCAQKRGLVTSQKGYLKGVFALRTLTWEKKRGLSILLRLIEESLDDSGHGCWKWLCGAGVLP